MARYYWLKLHDNFFDRMEIRKLRKIPGGDTYTIIYLKLLLLSLNSDGKIPFEGIETHIHKEIALMINEEDTSVEMALNAFQMLKLIEEREGDVSLPEHNEAVGKPKLPASSKKALPENVKRVYGTQKNVKLSDTEIDKLADFYGSERTMWEKIEGMSLYIGSTGKKYASHYLTLLQWAKKDGFGADTKKKPKATFKEEDWT